MEEDKKKMVLLIVQMVSMIQAIIQANSVAIKKHLDKCAAMALLLAQHCDLDTERKAWILTSREESSLASSISNQDFYRRMRMSKATFNIICAKLAPSFCKQDTSKCNTLENQVSLAIEHLTTGVTLMDIAKKHGIGVSTMQNIVTDFSHILNCEFCTIRWPSEERMQRWERQFVKLEGIQGVVGAIDTTHIPIQQEKSSHLNSHGFFSMVLQLVVAPNNFIWDYDFDSPGGRTDKEVLQNSSVGRRCEAGQLGDFYLAADMEYPCKPWLLTPNPEEAQSDWNYKLAMTRIPVEQTIAMLKGRFNILLRRDHMLSQSIAETVSMCILLHNLCVLHGDGFEDSWLHEAEVKTKVINNNNSLQQQEIDMKVAAYGLEQLQGLKLTKEEALKRVMRGVNTSSLRKRKRVNSS